MKYLSEYRDNKLISQLIKQIKSTVKSRWMLMEICGGQTHSLVKNGILDMLPEEIIMVHGPGCPVCVTPVSVIDKAVQLAFRKNTILCSFGDMLRVPGSRKSLQDARAEGASVKIVYSPLDALTFAEKNPDKEVIFFAVGFETTAPANALAVLQAKKMNLNNFSLLVSHVLVPPAMESILADEFNCIDAFLGAGHVCSVMGLEEYYPIVSKYKIPVVVTGFEPADLLEGILMAVKQLESGKHQVENQYSRVVKEGGNSRAREIIREVFTIADRPWRGIGTIPVSGYKISDNYKFYDAEIRFEDEKISSMLEPVSDCISGEILRGIKKPSQCPLFGKICTPAAPLGAPMVSSEGACAAYYHYNYQSLPVKS